MLTEFGKTIRKLRLDKGILLKQMADDIGMTSSYLSAIEHGKREIPKRLISDLSNTYTLTSDEEDNLSKAAQNSRSSIKLNLSGNDSKKTEFANSFARRFDDLSDDQISEIMKILNHE